MHNSPQSIRFSDDLSNVRLDHLKGFFVGWPAPPSLEKRLALLQGSSAVCIAWDGSTDVVAGFINALTDGHLCAFIPLLEVLPEYQDRGLASELVRRMVMRLDRFYAVDLVCDSNLCAFYEKFGFMRGNAMFRRNRDSLRLEADSQD